MSYRIGRVIGSKGPSFRAHSTSKPDELRDTSGIDVGARRNYDHEQAAVKKQKMIKRSVKISLNKEIRKQNVE